MTRARILSLRLGTWFLLGLPSFAGAQDRSQPGLAAPLGTTLPASTSLGAEATAAASSAAPQDSFYATGGATDSSSETSDSPSLDLYGFIDFTYTKNLDGSDSPYSKFPHFGTFAVGNVNLYAASNLGHGWRSLLEVRFLYLPDGADQAFNANGSVERTTDSAADYADFSRQLHWGGIEIQRALLEYQVSEWLAVQAGQFLTPYGIWNIDHGSPTVIPVRRPFVIGEDLFPAHQVGLEAHGSFHLDATTFGYHLTFSNGKGPIPYLDLDNNNALGARAFVRNTSFGTLTLGVSAYTGKYTDRSKSYLPKPGVTPTQLEIHDDIVQQYNEVVTGGDLRWEWNNLLVQGEFIASQRRYVDPYRGVADASGLKPNELNFGYYGLLGYRTPWLGVMPYVVGEYYNFQINALFPPAISCALGLNVRPQANVVFKLQYEYVQFGTVESREALRGTVHQADAQAAWAF